MDSENARWWNSETVAVVTGGNRGIGYEIVRQLAQQGLTVVLTARDESRGKAALHTLALTNVFFHSLDVQNPASIHKFALWLNNKFGKLHILINNAALNGVEVDYDYLNSQNLDLKDIIKRKDFSERIYRVHHDRAADCIDVNYYGVKRTIEALFPLLKSHSNSNGGARIINVSSSYGLLMQLRDKNLQQWIDQVENLTSNYIEEDFIGKFLEDVKKGEWSMDGKVWPSKHPVYKMSKIALNAYTRLLARNFLSTQNLQRQRQPLNNINAIHNKSRRNSQIFINCIHPGDVKTQLSFNNGDLSPFQGADPIVKLALMPAHNCPTGQFFFRYNASNFKIAITM